MAASSSYAAIFLASALAGEMSVQTPNFLITASNREMARAVADEAEALRRNLALEWLGRELPTWQQPCRITAKPNRPGQASGSALYDIVEGKPVNRRIFLAGNPLLVLQSALPHEVLRLVLNTHFQSPLPYWVEDGAGVTAQRPSSREGAQRLLRECLTTGRGIPFNVMYKSKEYPMDIVSLHAQGYSVVRYLVAIGGKRRFIAYIGDGLASNNWNAATRSHYAFEDVSELQTTWNDWVAGGCKPVPERTLPATATVPAVAEARPFQAWPVTPAAATTPPFSLTASNRCSSARGGFWVDFDHEVQKLDSGKRMSPQPAAFIFDTTEYPAGRSKLWGWDTRSERRAGQHPFIGVPSTSDFRPRRG
ncbi:MAG: hypothetical protein AAGF97_14800 [Planctomycetota bacterium]